MAFWDKWKKKRQSTSEEMTELEEILSLERESGKQMASNHGSGESNDEKSSGVGEVAVISRLSEKELEQEETIPVRKVDQKRFVLDCCEAIEESERQIEITKREYEQVTEYLMDIQKIDGITGENREEMLGLCQRISGLLKERNRYKNREMTIPELQVRRFDLYQDELIDEIKKMYQNEMYQKAIESDMGHLEREKAYQRHIQKEIMVKQNSLKGMAKILAALIISLFVMFLALYYTMKIDMTYPYLGTLLLAAVSATVIFLEANKNRHDMTLADRRLNKAISLLNRTKIKYINNVSVLDYDRQKYGVKDAADFEQLWGEYCKVKEYERKFRENTEQLNRCNEELLMLLTEYQLADPEVWLIQTYAILDNREMVEIRHDLNQRRQKLREQVEYNNSAKTMMLRRIKALMLKNPERKEELMNVVREFSRKKKLDSKKDN